MKRLMILLLAVVLLTGCMAVPAGLDASLPLATIPVASFVPETSTVLAQTLPPETTVPPETTLPPDPLDLLLADMSLEQKVGQLFIVAPEQLLNGSGAVTAVNDPLAEALRQYPVSGIILFADNIRTPEQLETLNRQLRESCGIAPFLAVDEEGGIVARLARNNAFNLPKYSSAAAVGASGDSSDALDMGRTIGAYLAQYGFNLDFAPVADVNTNPYNPVIGNRAFSSDPETAAEMVAAFAQGLRENGVIATYKHFPGHGDTAQDSHSALAVSNRTLEELEQCEFLPFLEAGSADMVMVGHIALPKVTGNMRPATLSRTVVTEILREQLSFSGLIVTDSMQMGAITKAYSAGEAAVGAFLAGCDIVLMPENLPEAFQAVLAALEDGTLSVDWLNSTVRRILEFKQIHGIL